MYNMSTENGSIEPKSYSNLRKSMLPSIFFVSILFILEICERLLNVPVTMLGNRPRQMEGIIGIFTMPLAHGDFQHLINNSGSLIVLSSFLFYFYKRVATKTLLWIWLLTGVGVWLFARANNHIGASGIVYGLAFFLFAIGLMRKDTKSMVIALVVSFFYGSMVWGVLPGQTGISWEGHLFGALSGIYAAYLYKAVDMPVYSNPEMEGRDDQEHEYWRDYVN